MEDGPRTTPVDGTRASVTPGFLTALLLCLGLVGVTVALALTSFHAQGADCESLVHPASFDQSDGSLAGIFQSNVDADSCHGPKRTRGVETGVAAVGAVALGFVAWKAARPTS